MRARTVVIGLVVVGGLSFAAGTNQTRVEYRNIVVHSPPQVITKVEEKEVIKSTPLPESCLAAVQLTKDSFEQDKLISKAAGELNEGVFNGVSQLAANNPVEWNKIEQDIYDAQRRLNEALTTKGELQKTLVTKQQKCDESLKQQ